MFFDQLAALLTLPERMPHEHKLKRVDEIIEMLELDKCKTTGNLQDPVIITKVFFLIHQIVLKFMVG